MSLEARALAFGYRGHPVGSGIDLTLEPGRVLCLLGPNGSGKTTLKKTLLGLLPPQGGEVRLDGRHLAQWSPRERATRLAYVPQAAESFFDFSIGEMVEMGRTAHRGIFARPSRRDAEVARQALDTLGIAALADRPIHRVSGGERQLGLIARALATEAAMLVLDEPTANLDFGNQMRVLGEIVRLKESGIAILLCSHDPGHALEVADEVLLIREGRTFARGRPAETITDPNLSRLYGIEVHYHGPHARPHRPAPSAP
jgi:iron complex transport system ATP-binding protein